MATKTDAVRRKRSSSFWLIQAACALTLAICVSCNAAPPTTYYIDFDGGNDGNKGDSASAAFKHCPGDKNATDRAKKTTLKAGDKVIFKGGTAYKGAIVLKWSGSSEKDIIYDGNSSNSFGTGKAVMDGDNLTYATAFDLPKKESFIASKTFSRLLKKVGVASTPSFLTSSKKTGFIAILNFEIRGYSRYGIYLHSGSNIAVKNCNVHRLSDWTLAGCSGATCNMAYVANLGTGINITGDSQNIIVDGCNLERTGHGGIKIQGNSHDVEVKNCDIHDYIHWMIDIAPLSSEDAVSNISVHNNKLRDLYHYASSWWTSWKGGGAHPEDEKIHPGTGEDPHIDGIFIRNPLGGILENIRIYSNDFYLDKRFSDHGGTAMLFVHQIGPADSIFIYNNVFQHCYMYQPVTMTTLGTGGEIHVYNNTFNIPEKGAMRIAGSGKFYVKNNIFNMENGLAFNFDDKAARQSLKSDYNVFKQGGGNIIYDGSWITSLQQWQMASGQDTNSQSVADVKFVSPQDIKNTNASNLRLQGASPAVNRGFELTEFFDIDKAGTKRPKGRPWDIGAYQSEEKQR